MPNAFRINTNIQAQQAFQNLSDTNDQLTQLRQRLTTGKRINEASDDAAGFEIANKLEAKTGAQDQALRNIGDAKSLLSTAEGALDSQLNILQTAKEKATQAANGSLSQDERDAIGKELNELASEINDIQQNATFNGQQLLSGDGSGNPKTFKFQTGAQSTSNKGQFSVDLKSSGTTDLGLGGTLDLSTSSGKSEALDVNQGDFGNNEGAGNISSSLTTGSPSATITGSAAVGADTDGSGNLKGNLEGGKFKVSVTEDGTNSDGNLTFQIKQNGEVKRTTTAAVGTSATDKNVTLEDKSGAKIKFNAGQAFDDGDVTAAEGTQSFTVEVTGGKLGDKLIGSSDEADARNVIDKVDNAINTVSSELSNLGASQNRLSFKESNLQTAKTNLESAQSRIEDADFAQTQTQVAKLQVQQQSGTAQLAQANAAGQSVLSLLQG